jgi:hypothetical protein
VWHTIRCAVAVLHSVLTRTGEVGGWVGVLGGGGRMLAAIRPHARAAHAARTHVLAMPATPHRREAERDAATEPLLCSFLYASILAHDTFERALAFVLSNRLASAVMLPTQLFEIFHEVGVGAGMRRGCRTVRGMRQARSLSCPGVLAARAALPAPPPTPEHPVMLSCAILQPLAARAGAGAGASCARGRAG